MDNRVLSLHQYNKGLAGARNTGIRHAHGKYLSFIDAGDYVELNLYESLLMYVKADIDLIDYPFFTQSSENERYPSVCKIEKNKVFYREFIEQEMLPCMLNIEDNPVVNDPPICFVWKYLFKKSIIDRNHILFDERRRKWEDKGFVVKYADCSETIVFHDRPLYTYFCLANIDHLSAFYFRDLVFLIIEQREEYQREYGERYSFETDYYIRNSISSIMARIEEIVDHETEEDAKSLMEQIYEKKFLRKIAAWNFENDDMMLQYQLLIKNNDIDGTYLLMKQQLEQKKKLAAEQRRASYIRRAKQRAKGILRPLYYKLKNNEKNRNN